ncbi:MAG: TonB-dependent receptor [Acidimicrobiia bacterium]|nr:TonB-dependent receptor [Acidimicrobiia bacterium]
MCIPTLNFEVAQSGQHRTTGVELDVNGRISDHVSLIGHYTTMNGRVITDPAFQPGRRIGGAPEHTGSLWLSVTKDHWTVAAGAFGRTQMKGFTSSDAFLPGYVTADGMAAGRWSPRLRLQLNVTNVFDRRTYITGAGSSIAYPGTPRSVKGAVTLTF